MKVSFKDDRMPDGTELYVRGLGMLVNGKSMEFSKEEVEAFESSTGKKLADAFGNDDRIKLGAESKELKGGDDS